MNPQSPPSQITAVEQPPAEIIRLNPFALGMSGKPIRGDRFVGRALELDRICQIVGAGGNVILHGPPRTGKSSLLAKFSDISPAKFGNGTSVHQTSGELLHGTEVEIREQLRGLVDSPDSEGPRILCFDEYQMLFNKHLGIALYLRKLADNSDLTMVVAWHEETVDPMADKYAVNAFGHIALKQFTLEEVKTMSAQYLVGTGFDFSEKEVTEIHKLTGGHPQRTQIAGFFLFESKTLGGGDWQTAYQAHLDEALYVYAGTPKGQRPGVDTLQGIIDVHDRSLRKCFKDAPPKNEASVRDAIDALLSAANYDFKCETSQMVFSMKGFRPDLSSAALSIYVEAKLCDSKARVKQLVDEMSADLAPYKQQGNSVLFVVYDNGGFIADPRQFAADFEAEPGVRIYLCKH